MDKRTDMTENNCCQPFAEEFQPEKITLNHDNPADFVTPQWPWFNQRLYIAYRVIVSLGLIGWLIADIFHESEVFYRNRMWIYLIYATNWSFILLTVTAVLQAICVLFYSKRSSCCIDSQSFENMPPSLKVTWLLQNISYNSAIVVSISFWSFIAFLDNEKIMQTDMSRLKHTLNTVYVIIDVIISATPIRTMHMFYTVMLGSLYSLFNAIYFLNDGTIIEGRHYAYNVLNWVNPAEAVITCVLCIVLAVISQTVLYGIYRLRFCIYSKYYFKDPKLEYDEFESEMRGIMSETQSYSTGQTT